MRLAPRLAVPVIVLTLVAGCGGSQIAFEEAPGGPAELTVPGDASALAPAAATATATAAPTEDASGEAAAETTPTPSPETPEQATPEGSAGGGTEAPAGEEDSADGAPPNSDASEEFCAMNPGAC